MKWFAYSWSAINLVDGCRRRHDFMCFAHINSFWFSTNEYLVLELVLEVQRHIACNGICAQNNKWTLLFKRCVLDEPMPVYVRATSRALNIITQCTRSLSYKHKCLCACERVYECVSIESSRIMLKVECLPFFVFIYGVPYLENNVCTIWNESDSIPQSAHFPLVYVKCWFMPTTFSKNRNKKPLVCSLNRHLICDFWTHFVISFTVLSY